MEPQLSKQQQEYLDYQNEAGPFLEIMIRDNGWKYVTKYYEAKVQAFANGLLSSGAPISEFENERQQIVGIKKLLGYIDDCIKTLKSPKK